MEIAKKRAAELTVQQILNRYSGDIFYVVDRCHKAEPVIELAKALFRATSAKETVEIRTNLREALIDLGDTDFSGKPWDFQKK